MQIIVVVVCGITANAFCVALIRQQRRTRSLPVMDFIIIQAIAASTYLVLTVLPPLESMVHSKIALFDRSQIGCAVVAYIGSVADAISTWSVVFACLTTTSLF